MQKKERIGRNPKTNDVFIIKKRNSISFTVSKNLLSRCKQHGFQQFNFVLANHEYFPQPYDFITFNHQARYWTYSIMYSTLDYYFFMSKSGFDERAEEPALALAEHSSSSSNSSTVAIGQYSFSNPERNIGF